MTLQSLEIGDLRNGKVTGPSNKVEEPSRQGREQSNAIPTGMHAVSFIHKCQSYLQYKCIVCVNSAIFFSGSNYSQSVLAVCAFVVQIGLKRRMQLISDWCEMWMNWIQILNQESQHRLVTLLWDMFNSDPCNHQCFITHYVRILCTALEFCNGTELHLKSISVSSGGP